MKDDYYGDKNDLWKWSILLDLADKGRNILYVAMYRKLSPPQEIDQRVWKHFRDLSRIKELDPRIHFFDDLFVHKDRNDYFEKVRQQITKLPKKQSLAVFVDPDTGLAPSKCKTEHVLMDELFGLWKALKHGDALMLYQHRDRKTGCFVGKKQAIDARLATDCRIEKHGTVAFLVCEK